MKAFRWRGCWSRGASASDVLRVSGLWVQDFGPGIPGGSWVVISRVISRLTILTTHIRRLITPFITTPSPKPHGWHLWRLPFLALRLRGHVDSKGVFRGLGFRVFFFERWQLGVRIRMLRV